MKKLLLILFLGLFAFTMQAQTATGNKYVNSCKNFSGWGTAADTVSNAGTVSYVVRVKTCDLMTVKIGFKSDSVSGTPAFVATFAGSMDGVNYDSIQAVTTSVSGVDTFYNYTAVDATYNYFRLQIVGAAAAMNATLTNYWTFRKKYN